MSSTFRDFQFERDLLNGAVRERLDELVRPLGWRVEMVDLRWGVETETVSEAEAQRRVLDVCLREIDRCRPLFVGLVGDRFGWVPPNDQSLRVRQEAGLPLGNYEGWSVTALEFGHGALLREEGSDTATFFMRQIVGQHPQGWADDDTAWTTWLRGWVLERSDRVTSYTARTDGVNLTDLGGFEDLAVEALAKVVNLRIEEAGGSGSEAIESAQRLYVQDRLRVVVGRDAAIESTVAKLAQSQNVVLYGPPGSGASTVLCAVVDRALSYGHRSAFHIVGSTARTSTHQEVIAHLAWQLGYAFPNFEENDDLFSWWEWLLGEVGSAVVAVDGLEDLTGGERLDLRFLSSSSPAGLVVATSSEEQRDALSRVGFDVVEISELSGMLAAETARGWAAAVGRTIPSRVEEVVASQERTPLWVRLCISALLGLESDELADAGSAKEIGDLLVRAVERFPESDSGAADALLQRLCDRVGPSTDAIVGAIALSRSGLASDELVRVQGQSQVDVARIRRALGDFLVEGDRPSGVRFNHPILVAAGRNRVRGREAELHRRLVKVLDSETDLKPDDELIWHALRGGEAEPLDRILHDLSYGTRDFDGLGQLIVDSIKLDRGSDEKTIEYLGALVGSEAKEFVGLQETRRVISKLRSTQLVKLPLASVLAPAANIAAGQLTLSERRRLTQTILKLAEDRPDRYLPDLAEHARAGANEAAGNVASDAGELSEAAKHFDSAIEARQRVVAEEAGSGSVFRWLTRRTSEESKRLMLHSLFLRARIAFGMADFETLEWCLETRDHLLSSLRPEVRSALPASQEALASGMKAVLSPGGGRWDLETDAVAAARERVARSSSSYEERKNLSAVLTVEGLRVWGSEEDQSLAIDLADEAVALARQTPGIAPGAQGGLVVLSNALLIAAKVRSDGPLLQQAELLVDESILLARSEVERTAGSGAAIDLLADGLKLLAEISWSLDDNDASRDAFAETIALRRQFVRSHGVAGHRHLASALRRAAQHHFTQDRFVDASLLATESAELCQAGFGVLPGEDMASLLAESLSIAVRCDLQQPDSSYDVDRTDRAVAAWRNSLTEPLSLAGALAERSMVLRRTGNSAEANLSLEEAMEVTKSLLDLGDCTSLPNAMREAAEEQLGEGRADLAAGWFERAYQHDRRLEAGWEERALLTASAWAEACEESDDLARAAYVRSEAAGLASELITTRPDLKNSLEEFVLDSSTRAADNVASSKIADAGERADAAVSRSRELLTALPGSGVRLEALARSLEVALRMTDEGDRDRREIADELLLVYQRLDGCDGEHPDRQVKKIQVLMDLWVELVDDGLSQRLSEVALETAELARRIHQANAGDDSIRVGTAHAVAMLAFSVIGDGGDGCALISESIDLVLSGPAPVGSVEQLRGLFAECAKLDDDPDRILNELNRLPAP